MFPGSPNGSLCLDGTPYGIYYKEGEEKENYVIYFEGGGACLGAD